MISELTDEEILEYLMTSDIIENFRPDEYKYLIFKFREIYRVLHGRHQLYKIDATRVIQELKSSAESSSKTIYDLQVKNANLENEVNSLKSPKKLTWKERITGKTIHKK